LDSECPSNKKCSNGECILKDKCSKDTDCVSGNVCKSGFCVTPAGFPQWAIGTIIGAGVLVILIVGLVIYFAYKK
jgi:hypothetical protein